MEQKLLFDRVDIKQDDGSQKSFRAEFFVAMPLHERVRLMLEHRLSFFNGADAIDGKSALRSLREWSAGRTQLGIQNR